LTFYRYDHFQPRNEAELTRFDLRMIDRASELHALLLTKS